MVKGYRWPYYLFTSANVCILIGLALICVLPMVHLLALSLSSKSAVEAGKVVFAPIGLHWSNYTEILQDDRFIGGFLVSVKRVLIGTAIQMGMAAITAYPLSREARDLKGRNFLMWFFIFPMLFSGGMIPTYLLIRDIGLLDTFWALVIGPVSLPIFSVILLMNFFRQLPKGLQEAAMIDGAGHLTILTRIFLPLSLPALATLTLFSIVMHWNSWFDAVIYLNHMDKWPIQAILRSFLMEQVDTTNITPEQLERMQKLSNRGLKAAQVFIVTLPILLIYPFLQKYFVKGIVLGSVKE